MPSPPDSHPLRKRLVLFVSCCAIGTVIGFIGKSLTGSDYWYLAVPVLIASAWLFVANPAECAMPRSSIDGGTRPGRSDDAQV